MFYISSDLFLGEEEDGAVKGKVIEPSRNIFLQSNTAPMAKWKE